MKRYFLIIFIIISSCKGNTGKEVSFPLVYHDGYGPFIPGWSLLSPELKNVESNDEWVHMRLPIKNIPSDWSYVKRDMIMLDIYQLVYQNYKQGKVSEQFYLDLQKSSNLVPDETNFSESPIKCYVYVIWGVNRDGNWAAMVDTNNNLDFGDEDAFYPEVILQGDSKSWNEYSTYRMVSYEKVLNGRTIETNIPVVIKQFGAEFVYNFPFYATAEIEADGQKYSIAIASGSSTTANFETSFITVLPESKDKYQVEKADLVGLGQVFSVGDVLNSRKFKHLGVDRYNDVLLLEGGTDSDYSNIVQAGYQLDPFEATEFSSRLNIGLDGLKGKYVFLEFWGTWCRGCMLALPHLNRIYQKVDKSKVEFVGIVEDDSLRLAKGIRNHNIKWPQILANDSNKLIEKYKITGFPTSLLLDKEGKILAMNLSPNELEEKLSELLGK